MVELPLQIVKLLIGEVIVGNGETEIGIVFVDEQTPLLLRSV